MRARTRSRTVAWAPVVTSRLDPEAPRARAPTVYTLWKVRLADDGLGPVPELIDLEALRNETIQWILTQNYDNLLPYGGTLPLRRGSLPLSLSSPVQPSDRTSMRARVTAGPLRAGARMSPCLTRMPPLVPAWVRPSAGHSRPVQ